jgi:hypothetical protein
VKRRKFFLVALCSWAIAYYGLGIFSGSRLVGPLQRNSPDDCKFAVPGQSVLQFEMELAAEECHLMEYFGFNVLNFYVDYPSMKVVSQRVRPRKPEDNNVVVLWVSRNENIDSYDEDATILRSKPIHTVERVQNSDGAIEFSRFIGVDLRSVYLRNGYDLNIVRRVFDNKFSILYQYSNSYKDVKEMDRFVVDFLKKIKIK